MRLVILVTPHVGVWIETLNTDKQQLENMVTPHVGVWIETMPLKLKSLVIIVTPHVGVWIETYRFIARATKAGCHTSCRCVD